MHAATERLVARVLDARRATMRLTEGLEVEDWTVQSMPDASPVKWHLAHTTWFFDRFVLTPLGHGPVTTSAVPACLHAARYDYLFNSYYESVGSRQPRPRRGMLTRPTVAEVLAYREAVDRRLADLSPGAIGPAVARALDLGTNHEEQHQELILTDLKHLFAESPLAPAYRDPAKRPATAGRALPLVWCRHEEGLVTVGASDDGFTFDNERPPHRVFVPAFEVASRLVTVEEYLAFIGDRGYQRPELWLSEGWAWVHREPARPAVAPAYWNLDDRALFTLHGTRTLDPVEPVCHVTYYEADAYARWAGARLLREEEWEVAATRSPSRLVPGVFVEDGHLHPVAASAAGLAQMLGDAWEWTQSAYAPYPGFVPLPGAFAEYNGKFMVSQMVLRGGSAVTPRAHIRPTYRNFFPPSAAWQFTGIRLAKDVA